MERMMGGSVHDARQALEIAERVRLACIKAAIDGYERAEMSGLCREGAWEAAVSAMRMLDLQVLLDVGGEHPRHSAGNANARPSAGTDD